MCRHSALISKLALSLIRVYLQQGPASPFTALAYPFLASRLQSALTCFPRQSPPEPGHAPQLQHLLVYPQRLPCLPLAAPLEQPLLPAAPLEEGPLASPSQLPPAALPARCAEADSGWTQASCIVISSLHFHVRTQTMRWSPHLKNPPLHTTLSTAGAIS